MTVRRMGGVVLGGATGVVLAGAAAWGALPSKGATVRVSTNASDVQTTYDIFYADLSSNGRYVAFQTSDPTLVPGDTGGDDDVFVRDLKSGKTARVSLTPSGTQANGPSISPELTGNGRAVVFLSDATDLVAGDTNGSRDVFVRDLAKGATTRVSVSTSGAQASARCYLAHISSNGRYVSFSTVSPELVEGDANSKVDVFVRDLRKGTTTRVSVNSSGAEATGDSYESSLSANGRLVAFSSSAGNLVAGDTNGKTDVFVRDLKLGTTTRISVDSMGAQAIGGNSVFPAISDNGRFVAFLSSATNLVANDTNGHQDVFVRDLATGTTTLCSPDVSGAAGGDDDCYNLSIDATGRYVAFDSYASNLVPNDTNGIEDCFIRDTVTGTTTRVSVDSAGAQATGNDSFAPILDAKARFVLFVSYAENLIPGDSNGTADAFLRRFR